METITITYYFELEPGQVQKYELSFNSQNMQLVPNSPKKSEWTKLENKKCSHCPLNSNEHPHCPIAFNLESVADYFSLKKSFSEAKVTVITQERTYFKKVSLQEGLQGIFGLIMATSGCPHMDFLKPMARFHLPFSTYVETIVRSTSFYLMKQYFLLKDGHKPDLALKGLENHYAQVAKVNKGIVDRIRGVSPGDADRNALVILDCFAQLLTTEISGNMQEVRKAIEY